MYVYNKRMKSNDPFQGNTTSYEALTMTKFCLALIFLPFPYHPPTTSLESLRTIELSTQQHKPQIKCHACA